MGQKLCKGSLPSDPPLALKHQFSLSTISTYSCQEQMSLAVAAMCWLWWIGETCSSWVFRVSIWAPQKKTKYVPQMCWLRFLGCAISHTSFHQKPFSLAVSPTFSAFSCLPYDFSVSECFSLRKYVESCGWGQKPRCALGHVEEISSDHLISCLLIFQWELPNKVSLYLTSHLILRNFPLPHASCYIISYIYIYTLSL